jgi:4-hydroxy-tetrahydrodipicolinate reductase
MNIALIGYGKMGRAIEPIAIERGHTIVFRAGREGFTAADIATADVCIEFSTPETAAENIIKALGFGKPVVCGTTAWLNQWPLVAKAAKETHGAFFYASNFSLGVNIFFALNTWLAKVMNGYPQYDVAVHEIHHTQKKDAPSGTAITLAQKIVAEMDRKTGYGLGDSANELLNITSDRIDPAPGTHHVKYSSVVDDIELIHTAHSRLGFATGAVVAAEWLQGKSGIFGMDDLLNLNA